MKFCICNEIFQDWDLRDQFQATAQMGFDALEIAPFTIDNSVRNITSQTREHIRQLSAQFEVEIAGIHWLLAGTTGYHVTDPDDTVRDE